MGRSTDPILKTFEAVPYTLWLQEGRGKNLTHVLRTGPGGKGLAEHDGMHTQTHTHTHMTDVACGECDNLCNVPPPIHFCPFMAAAQLCDIFSQKVLRQGERGRNLVKLGV